MSSDVCAGVAAMSKPAQLSRMSAGHAVPLERPRAEMYVLMSVLCQGGYDVCEFVCLFVPDSLTLPIFLGIIHCL